MPSRELVNPISDLFDAAVRHQTIRLECPRCGHAVVYDPHALWWFFERKHWPDRLNQVPRRFHCRPCRQERNATVRPRLTLTRMEPTVPMAMPDIREWKRAMSRRR